MTEFQIIYIRRSDGQKMVAGKPNYPHNGQLNQKEQANGSKDYYHRLDEDSTKHRDWRKKLGAMMAKRKGLLDDKGYILAWLPEHYELWEHIKTRPSDSSPSKSHAGGGHDRQDAYLYGHPLGTTKRFRSPKDFYHHLLWLSEDEEGNPDNCYCRACAPPEDMQKKIQAESKSPTTTATGSANSQAVDTNPQVVIGKKSTPTPTPASFSQPLLHPQPSPLPNIQPNPQQAAAPMWHMPQQVSPYQNLNWQQQPQQQQTMYSTTPSGLTQYQYPIAPPQSMQQPNPHLQNQHMHPSQYQSQQPPQGEGYGQGEGEGFDQFLDL